MGLRGAGGVINFSVGICDGAPSTARSSFSFIFSFLLLTIWYKQDIILSVQNKILNVQDKYKIKGMSVCLHVCTYACMLTDGHMYGPPGFFVGSGEKGYLFSGSWGALVIIFRELGSKLMVSEI